MPILFVQLGLVRVLHHSGEGLPEEPLLLAAVTTAYKMWIKRPDLISPVSCPFTRFRQLTVNGNWTAAMVSYIIRRLLQGSW